MYCERMPVGVEGLADGFAIFGRGLAPVALDGSPGVAETFFVGVAVLRDDGGDALGMRHGEAEAGGGAVVEDVEGVAREVEGVGEGDDGFRECVEGVFVVALGGDFGEAEAGEVGSDDAVTVGEARDEFAILEGRCGEAVEEKHDGRVGGPASR